MPTPVRQSHYTKTFGQYCREADPDFERDRVYSIEYEFASGRIFRRRVDQSLIYLDDEED